MRHTAAATGLVMLIALAGASATRGDSVYLHDGRIMHGKVTSPPDAGIVVIETPFGATRHPASRVKRIEKNDKGIPGKDQPGKAEDQADKVSPEQRAEFVKTARQADQVTTAREGQALWKDFLARHADGPLAELANSQLATWNERVQKGLIRFGPEWLPKKQVYERMARAEKLVAQAASAEKTKDALKLLTEASEAHPYRADIPFRRAVLLYGARREREFGTALGDVVKVDESHVAARNNLAVLASTHADWTPAILNATRAAHARPDLDTVLDNLDQVLHMAESAGFKGSALAEARKGIDALVERLHAQDKCVGKVRWGASWIAVEKFDQYAKDNRKLNDQLGQTRDDLAEMKKRHGQLKKEQKDLEKKLGVMARSGVSTRRLTDARTELESREILLYLETQRELEKVNKEIDRIEADARKKLDETKKLQAKLHVPPRADRLILLKEDAAARLGEVAVDPDTQQAKLFRN